MMLKLIRFHLAVSRNHAAGKRLLYCKVLVQIIMVSSEHVVTNYFIQK